MDGWGSLTMLIKRQEVAKARKSKLRYELQKRKEAFLSNKLHNELEFPEISDFKMKILKQQIRNNYKRERIQSFIVFTVIIALIIILLYLLFLN